MHTRAVTRSIAQEITEASDGFSSYYLHTRSHNGQVTSVRGSITVRFSGVVGNQNFCLKPHNVGGTVASYKAAVLAVAKDVDWCVAA